MYYNNALHFNLSEKQRDDFLMVEDAFRASSNAKADFMRKALDWYKKYNMYAEKPSSKAEERRARVAKPHAYSIVEHSTATMKSVLFPSDAIEKVIRVLPRNLTDVEAAEAVEILINYQLNQSRVRYKGEMWLRGYNLFGVGVAYPYWRRIYRTRHMRYPLEQYNPASGKFERYGLGKPERTRILEYDQPDFDIGDIGDFFPDPGARSFLAEDLRWAVRRYYISYEQLKLRVKSNPDLYDQSAFNLLSENDIVAVPIDDSFSEEVSRYHRYDFSGEEMARKGMMEAKCYLSDDKIIEVVNHQVPIMSIDNPYWIGKKPVIVATRLPITNYPWGKGRIEPIDHTIQTMQALTNALLDTVNLSVNPPWLIRRGANIDKSQLRNFPNNFLEQTMKGDIEKLEVQDTTAPGLIMEERLRQELEQTEPSLGISRGEIPANIRSFGQQASLIEKVQERNQMDIENFAETGLKPLAEWYHSLNQMFITEDTRLRIMENDAFKWVNIAPDEILGSYDFEIVASAKTTPKAVETQQRFAFMQQVLPILQNPTGIPDATFKLIAKLARNVGYNDEARMLEEVAQQIMIDKMTNKLNMVLDPSQNQKIQGGRGALAINSAPGNTPQSVETIGRQASQQLSPDSFDIQ